MSRVLKLDNEHIIDSGYTLPSSDWRVSRGYEHFTQNYAYIAFMVHFEVETDAYRTIEDAVSAAWRKHHEQADSGAIPG